MSVTTNCDKCGNVIGDPDWSARKISISGIYPTSWGDLSIGVDLCGPCANEAIPRILAP